MKKKLISLTKSLKVLNSDYSKWKENVILFDKSMTLLKR